MHERFPHAEMADEFDRMIASKSQWLRNFSSGQYKRPDHEIEHKRHELHVLEQAAFDYRRAADRPSKEAATGTGVGTRAPVAAGENRRFGERQNLHPRQ